MLKYINELSESLNEAVTDVKVDAVALSGGLDSSIVGYLFGSQKPPAISVITEDFVATDLTYCQMMSQHLDLSLTIIKADMAEIFDAIENTIQILKNFNDIEIRNNIVIYIALKNAKEMGWETVATGDGADELFAGYNFLTKKDNDELRPELKRLAKVMDFPSQRIAQHLQVDLVTPFLDENVVRLSQRLPPELLVRKEGEEVYGKWILRKAFEEKIPRAIAWRRKSPMQDGSGTSGMPHFFDSIMNDDVFFDRIRKIKDTDGVRIRSKESLFYYETFRKFFDLAGNNSTNEQHSCPYCGFKIDENSRFCKMCGAYPL